ncbi:hypothetical protein HELRODRAFT_175493 [Helobdella robusta]|uniref:Apple domain-containing protein n=1 Tax=Helobdella robusta TaxID=6412 RepID=T1F9B8_HELRO|nr:hypothetical protein HELRODRAFT_175493 [Helobdella robusta]ESO00535.1 hypothetical protein HELRODRAFT_175493 [Helobdella robusta]
MLLASVDKYSRSLLNAINDINMSFIKHYMLVILHCWLLSVSASQNIYLTTWQFGLFNEKFFVCSEDFQTKSTVAVNSTLECALLCATTQFSKCLSFNFLASQNQCQIFPYLSKHFNARSVTDKSCLYYYQSELLMLKFFFSLKQQGNQSLLANVSVNSALQKPTYSSPLYLPGPTFSNYSVDGIRSGFFPSVGCFHSAQSPPSWLAVDLLETFVVYYVMLVNRDAVGERLSRYIVGLNRSLRSVVKRWDYDLCGQYPKVTVSASWYITLCNSYSYAHRYVIVQSANDTDQYLTVCELEVYGQ